MNKINSYRRYLEEKIKRQSKKLAKTENTNARLFLRGSVLNLQRVLIVFKAKFKLE